MKSIFGYCEHIYDKEGRLIDSIRRYKLRDNIYDDEPWFTQPARILINRFGFQPNGELIKFVESLAEEHLIEVWYFLYNLQEYSSVENLEKNLWFLVNNYIPHIEKLNDIPYRKLVDFCEKTVQLDSHDRKSAFQKFRSGQNIDDILKYIQKDTFDISLLEFLDGKITDSKTVNWGVGQIMKKYPKKFNAKEVKNAIINRWNIKI